MTPPASNGSDRQIGEIVSEVSEKASLLVREEIELAKAEVTAKAKTMARGAGVGAAAGVFLVFALVMFLNTLAWFLVELLSVEIWVGFGLTTLILVVFAVIAGLLAKKWLSAGPPTPDMAIEEAKIARESLEHPEFDRAQLERAVEAEEAAEAAEEAAEEAEEAAKQAAKETEEAKS